MQAGKLKKKTKGLFKEKWQKSGGTEKMESWEFGIIYLKEHWLFKLQGHACSLWKIKSLLKEKSLNHL